MVVTGGVAAGMRVLTLAGGKPAVGIAAGTVDLTTELLAQSLFILLGLALAPGWLVLPFAGAVAAVVFGQVTVNETMTARYISPELRTKMYSIRFFVGFLGSAAAPPRFAKPPPGTSPPIMGRSHAPVSVSIVSNSARYNLMIRAAMPRSRHVSPS